MQNIKRNWMTADKIIFNIWQIIWNVWNDFLQIILLSSFDVNLYLKNNENLDFSKPSYSFSIFSCIVPGCNKINLFSVTLMLWMFYKKKLKHTQTLFWILPERNKENSISYPLRSDTVFNVCCLYKQWQSVNICT